MRTGHTRPILDPVKAIRAGLELVQTLPDVRDRELRAFGLSAQQIAEIRSAIQVKPGVDPAQMHAQVTADEEFSSMNGEHG